MKKKEGFVEFAVALFVIFMIAIMIKFTMDFREMRLVDEYLEDALASAVLGAAVVDLDTYGATRDIVIQGYHGRESEGADPINGFRQSYNNFVESFKASLGGTPVEYNEKPKKALEYGRSKVIDNITIESFQVYNYVGGSYRRLYMPDDLLVWDKIADLSPVVTPNYGVTHAKTNPIVGSSSEYLVDLDGNAIGTTIYVKIGYSLALPNGKDLGTRGFREYKVSIYEEVVTP